VRKPPGKEFIWQESEQLPPPPVVAAATRARRAGDWRGACAAAGFDVDVGADNRDRMRADLAAFTPDLVHQYLVRNWRGDLVERVYLLSPLDDLRTRPAAGTRCLTVSIAPGYPPCLSVRVPSKSSWNRPRSVLPTWCWRADAIDARRAAYTWLAPSLPTAGVYPFEVERLVSGELAPELLHPSVRDVLYPGGADLVASQWRWPPVLVDCEGGWHRLYVEGGRLRAADHDEAEIQREFALRAFGGRPNGCAAALHTLRTGGGRTSPSMFSLRWAFYDWAHRGYTDPVVAHIDAGFDITIPDNERATLLHFLGRLDYARLWPRLRNAGLSVHHRDSAGRTPLHCAAEQGCEPLMRLLLDAGADPAARDGLGHSVEYKWNRFRDHPRWPDREHYWGYRGRGGQGTGPTAWSRRLDERQHERHSDAG
jgi:Ankyrin repeat